MDWVKGQREIRLHEKDLFKSWSTRFGNEYLEEKKSTEMNNEIIVTATNSDKMNLLLNYQINP
jgi:hypothetical protein